MGLNRAETIRVILDIVDGVRGWAVPHEESWNVCVLDEDRETIGSFSMASLAHVSELRHRLAPHGYRMKLLDPAKRHCDFVFQPPEARSQDDDVFGDADD